MRPEDWLSTRQQVTAPGKEGPAEPRAPAYPRERLLTLSRREREVLRELATGKSNREIASALFLSLLTIKTYLRHIFQKLNVSNRVQAVLWWQQWGGEDETTGTMDDRCPAFWPAARRDSERLR